MGILTDFWFGLGHFFLWTYKYILEPIADVSDWILFVLGVGLIGWWLFKLASFGNKEDKEYKGW